MERYNLSARELEVMEILWKNDEAMSAANIFKASKLSKNTVQTVIKSLLNKKYLVVDGVGYSGTVLARNFLPAFSVADYIRCNFSTEYKKSSFNIIASLIQGEEDEEIINNLSAVLEKRKKELRR